MTQDELNTDTHIDSDGIIRWNSNDAVPFDDLLESMGLSVYQRASHKAARDAEAAEAIAAYIARRANVSDEQRAEENFERLAAFGPDVEVVDILSGERFRT